MGMNTTWTVNVQSAGESQAPSVSHHFDTKREALTFIRSLGKIAMISRVGRSTYSVRPKSTKK